MRPLLYSHRGASIEQPENTMPSFRRAAEIGVDVFETDAHMTSDGHIVVSHDADGGRMCGVPREIRRCTLAEVQRWDAGHGFVDAGGARPFAGKGYRIPTLAELAEEFPDTPLNIDLKQPEPSMVQPAIDLLRRLGAEPRVTLASFHARTMRAVRKRGYRGPTAFALPEVLTLLAVPLALRRFKPVRGTAVQVPPRSSGVNFASRWFIRKCHMLGLRVDYWTINDATEAERLLDLGADGIMTDDPAALAPVFARRYG